MREHRQPFSSFWGIATALIALVAFLAVLVLGIQAEKRSAQKQAEARRIEIMEASARSQERTARALEVLMAYEAMRWGALTPAQADARVKALLGAGEER